VRVPNTIRSVKFFVVAFKGALCSAKNGFPRADANNRLRRYANSVSVWSGQNSADLSLDFGASPTEPGHEVHEVLFMLRGLGKFQLALEEAGVAAKSSTSHDFLLEGRLAIFLAGVEVRVNVSASSSGYPQS
jgi:hypothetical protein